MPDLALWGGIAALALLAVAEAHDRPVRSEDVIYNVNGIRVKTGLLLPANKAQFGG